MAQPTVKDHQTRVIKAFNKMGWGGKFATYSCWTKEDNIVCIHRSGQKLKHYLRILHKSELEHRAGDLTQTRYADITQTFTHLKDSEMHAVYVMVTNMFSKLHSGRPQPQYMYYDATKDSVIARCGAVIVEIELILNHRVNIATNALYAYLKELGEMIPEAGTSVNAQMFTMYGVLRITLDDGGVIYPGTTVDEFKRLWEVD